MSVFPKKDPSTVPSAVPSSVPYLELTVDDGPHLVHDAKGLVHRLRNDWQINEINVKKFSDGYNNKLVACTHVDDAGAMSDAIVVRVYGRNTELMVNRDQEITCQILFHRVGCAPLILCRFRNGFAYQYSPGQIYDRHMAYEPQVMRLLTQELARVHSVKPDSIPGEETIHIDVQPRLFQALDNFLKIIPDSFEEPEKQAKLEKMAASRRELRAEVEYLRIVLPPLGSPIVLCHNDLLFNNILYNKDAQKVTFIDFEYAAFNYEAFDIATHFCEYAGMKEIDYSQLPDHTYQLTWLRSYLENSFRFQGRGSKEVSEADVEKLYSQVNWFTLVAHMFWGLWALVQAKHSDIDYDYLEYSSIRITEYYKKKVEFLAV